MTEEQRNRLLLNILSGYGGGVGAAVADTVSRFMPNAPATTNAPAIDSTVPSDPVAAAQAAYNTMVARRGEAARAAVLGKIREQQEAGVIPYAPENPAAADEELRNRIMAMQKNENASLPLSVKPMFAGSVQTLQQRPTGGVVADYGGGNRVVTSRYGTGTATAGPRKGEMTITEDGKTVPGSQWFQEAADRQNRVVDMGEGGALYVPKARQAEFAEGARRLKAAEKASASKAKA